MKRRRTWFAVCAAVFAGGCARGNFITSQGNALQPLGSEQYIWALSPSSNGADTRMFKKEFSLVSIPSEATLYVFGPYTVDVTVNGSGVVQHAQSGPTLTNERPLEIADVSHVLRSGTNSINVTASVGDLLGFKIVPADQGTNTRALVVSDGSWEGSADGSTWVPVSSFGSLDSNVSQFRANFDLNLYQWPGYQGMNALLDHVPVEAVSSRASGNSITLDFGKEIAGRLRVDSSASTAVRLQMNFGETLQEATPETSSLGSRDLLVPAGRTAYGPLTAFRYVEVVFSDGGDSSKLLQIQADEVFRNLQLVREYQTSDPQLLQIWKTSVYTAQLGMQTEFWDAPKRDRWPYAADLFVGARAARAAFGKATDALVKYTLEDLAKRQCLLNGLPTTGKDINCIASFNAWWILDLGDLYRSDGDNAYLAGQHENLKGIVGRMRTQLKDGLFVDDPNTFLFADWSPGMYHYPDQVAPEAAKITTMAYYMGFREAAFLFDEMGDSQSAADCGATAAEIREVASSAYFDLSTGAFGDRLQTNAMAVFSGIADPSRYDGIYTKVLSQPPSLEVTPYFYYFVLEAMEMTGHRAEAVEALRKIWGGMLNAGATAFWEIDPPGCGTVPDVGQCLIEDFDKLSSQGNRYIISMAHGWASGPAAFLMEDQP